MNTMINATICIALSVMLMSGSAQFMDFAYYIQMTLNILGWMLLIPIFSNVKALSQFKARLWMIIPTRAILIYALIYSGSSGLAASSFILLALMMAGCFTKHPEKPLQH